MPRAAAKPDPAPPEPIQPPSVQDITEDAQHRRILALLVDLGAALAKEIVQAAPNPDQDSNVEAPTTVAARAEAFERVTRATRRTILVARHVAQQIAQRAAELQRAPSVAQRRTTARARLIREVEDSIQTKARPAEADALRAELIDRLDAPELESDLINRPTADLIADFLRDLGLAHPPGGRPPSHPIGRRTPSDIARLNLIAALPPGQAAVLAATLPLPKPTPPPPRPAPPRPTLKKQSWRDKPKEPDPDTGIRPDSLLASILKTTER